MEPAPKLAIGIDIGGTKVAGGLVDARGEIHARSRTAMITSGEASKRGCIETLAAGPVIGRRAGQKFSKYPNSLLCEFANGDAGAVSSEMAGLCEFE